MTPAGVALRLALAHHPLCHVYENDVWHLWGAPVCRGCLVFWPSALLAWPLALAGILGGVMSPGQAIAAGAVLGFPQMVAAAVRFRGLERRAVKALGGAGLAVVLAGILLSPVAMGWRIAMVAGVWLTLLGFLLLRARSIIQTCKACPWNMDWDHCPGMLGKEAA